MIFEKVEIRNVNSYYSGRFITIAVLGYWGDTPNLYNTWCAQAG